MENRSGYFKIIYLENFLYYDEFRFVKKKKIEDLMKNNGIKFNIYKIYFILIIYMH